MLKQKRACSIRPAPINGEHRTVTMGLKNFQSPRIEVEDSGLYYEAGKIQISLRLQRRIDALSLKSRLVRRHGSLHITKSDQSTRFIDVGLSPVEMLSKREVLIEQAQRDPWMTCGEITCLDTQVLRLIACTPKPQPEIDFDFVIPSLAAIPIVLDHEASSQLLLMQEY